MRIGGLAATTGLVATCVAAPGCTTHREATPPQTPHVSAESKQPSAMTQTFAPFTADPSRRVLVRLITGSGDRRIAVPAFRGDYEIEFQCLGQGSATYGLDSREQSWRCGTPILDERTATGATHHVVFIRADSTTRWQLLMQQGHTPVE